MLAKGSKVLSAEQPLLSRSSRATEMHPPRREVLAPFANTDSIPWPAIVVDETGIILHLNIAMQDRGLTLENIEHREVEKLFPEYIAALGGEVPWLTAQDVCIARQAADRTVHERVWVRRLPRGACLIIVDETRMHELEIEHAQTARLASLGFMLASVSHEINNPLSAIHSILQILQAKRSVSQATLETGILNIATSVRRILAITRKLNQFTRVGDAAAMLFPIDNAIEEAVVLFGYDSLGETIELDHVRAPQAAVWGHPGQLQQIFYNIFLNAAQAMRGCGSIQVWTERSGPMIEIAIRDTGPGLPPQLLDKVFEPFFTTKQKGEGTGLGLAISLQIAHEHGGEILAENHVSGGACFRVRLPFRALAD